MPATRPAPPGDETDVPVDGVAPPVEPDVVAEAPAARSRRTSWIAGSVVLGLLVVGASAGELLARTHRGPDGEAVSTPGTNSASRVPASGSVPPSPPLTIPSPPAGFKTVDYRDTLTIAVPQKWLGGNDSWSSPDERPHPWVHLIFIQDTVCAEVSAATYLTEREQGTKQYHAHHRIRLTDIDAPVGGTSAAEWEYTTTSTHYSQGGYGRYITRAITLANGDLYLFSVSMDADSRTELNREWAQMKPTLTRILNSARLIGVPSPSMPPSRTN
ncbi:hypothetical protein Q0Z83_024460 [Actinoplanes sichuanensis]|uniref:Uncharacterized protein n=1 Tax=Actinoplanes sichuanensis TaxID=512349 RepID=A0ABW4A232_9ACTN|nr:hypothetical protein [Actinoplanes sichuanensis]BEL04255.1 hypothetical protein Q0Z83_024460 [Actinoplanes sichuanensis]